mgnify:CR=1 FL=1
MVKGKVAETPEKIREARQRVINSMEYDPALGTTYDSDEDSDPELTADIRCREAAMGFDISRDDVMAEEQEGEGEETHREGSQ